MTERSEFHGVSVSTRVMPAALAFRGGDWCEAFLVRPDVVAFSIGDVCGHGAAKFPAMIVLRQAIRNAVRDGLDPAQTLVRVNRFLGSYDAAENATAIVAFLDTRKRSLAFANAGHPAPLMVSSSGSRFLEFAGADLPLGIDAEIVPPLHVIRTPLAAMFVFYTDGVIEHMRDPLQGELQLRDAAQFAYAMPQLPSAAVIEQRMLLTGSNSDDAAILTAWTPFAHVNGGATNRYGSGRSSRVLKRGILAGGFDR